MLSFKNDKNGVLFVAFDSSSLLLFFRFGRLNGNSLSLATKAMLVDPPDGGNDKADDNSILKELDHHDPENDLSHVAHVAVGALARGVEALLTAAIAALIVIGALCINGLSFEASLVFAALHVWAVAAVVGRVVNRVA